MAVANLAAISKLAHVWRRLSGAGLSPILIKGWSTARLYPDLGMRRLGDFDLCFTSGDLVHALQIRDEHPMDFVQADFHEGVPDLPDRTWAEVFARTREVPLDGIPIRILGWEEHLRLTCLHAVRHGLLDFQQLCDVAVILESLPRDFDWDECLRGQRRARRWLLTILGLAHEMLDAEIRSPEILRQATPVPAWLKDHVPRLWAARTRTCTYGYYLRRPRDAWTALRYRYFNPIRLSYKAGVVPRNRLEVTATVACHFVLMRAPRFLAGLMGELGARLCGGPARRPRGIHREKGRMK